MAARAAQAQSDSFTKAHGTGALQQVASRRCVVYVSAYHLDVAQSIALSQ
jgi:hypothetical protein